MKKKQLIKMSNTVKLCLLLVLLGGCMTTKDSKKQNIQNSNLSDDNAICEMPDEMPQFPGGFHKLMSFLRNNLVYPDEAQKMKIEGRVIVQFIINKEGSISDIHVLRSVSSLLDDEAVRLIKSMPKWKPGVYKGKKVRVKYTVPIMFKL